MNGRVLISGMLLVAGMILFLFGIGHNSLSSGMSFAQNNKTLLLILGIVLTLIGFVAFFYFIYKSLRRAEEAHQFALEQKDTTKLTAHEFRAAPYGETP